MGSSSELSAQPRWVGEARKTWSGQKLDGPFGRRVRPDPDPVGRRHSGLTEPPGWLAVGGRRLRGSEAACARPQAAGLGVASASGASTGAVERHGVLGARQPSAPVPLPLCSPPVASSQGVGWGNRGTLRACRCTRDPGVFRPWTLPPGQVHTQALRARASPGVTAWPRVPCTSCPGWRGRPDRPSPRRPPLPRRTLSGNREPACRPGFPCRPLPPRRPARAPGPVGGRRACWGPGGSCPRAVAASTGSRGRWAQRQSEPSVGGSPVSAPGPPPPTSGDDPAPAGSFLSERTAGLGLPWRLPSCPRDG